MSHPAVSFVKISHDLVIARIHNKISLVYVQLHVHISTGAVL